MILVKIHPNGIVSLCDFNLLGKSFEENELCIEVTERFYKGEKMDENKIIELIQNSENLNIVGEESIKLAIKAKVINPEHVLKIKGIPHAQTYAV